MPLKDYLFTSESVTRAIPTRSATRSRTRSSTPARAGPEQPRRLRVADQDRHRQCRRRDHDEARTCTSPRSRRSHPRHRLHVARHGLRRDTCAVVTAIERQSPDISQGVTEVEGLHKEQGAGDQGLMFGYACDETEELMPFADPDGAPAGQPSPQIRQCGQLPYLRPDGKSQVRSSTRTDEPARVDTVVVSSQHAPTSRTTSSRPRSSTKS